MQLFRRFIKWNRKASQWFVRMILPASCRIEDNRDYVVNLIQSHVRAGDLVYDVEGGKNSFFSPDEKRELSILVIGIDISEQELARAPVGAYNELLACNIA